MRDEALDRAVPRIVGRKGGKAPSGPPGASSTRSEHGDLQIINDLRDEISRLHDGYAKLKREYETLDRKYEKLKAGHTSAENRLRAIETHVRKIMELKIANSRRPIAAVNGSSPYPKSK